MCPMSPKHKHRYNTKLILTAKVYLALRDHVLLSTPEQCLRDGAWWHEKQESWDNSTLFFSTELMGMKLLTVRTERKRNRVTSYRIINSDRLRWVMQWLCLKSVCKKAVEKHKTLQEENSSSISKCSFWKSSALLKVSTMSILSEIDYFKHFSDISSLRSNLCIFLAFIAVHSGISVFNCLVMLA